VINELGQRCLPLAQLVVIGKLIGQAGNVREQVADCHILPAIARECGQELLHAVMELELPLIEQAHKGRHADQLGNGAEQEHGVAGRRFAEVAREGLIFVNHMQHRGINLPRRGGSFKHFGCVIPPPPAQCCVQRGSSCNA
jgi:hypothetical protein